MSRVRCRVDPAEVVARAAAHVESYDNAPPRRPMHGHTADCPERLKGPAQRVCRFCRGEALGQHRVNGVPVPPRSVLAEGQPRRHLAAVPDVHPDRPRHPEPEREPELRSCRGCFTPTTADLCPKCEAGA